MNIDSCMRNRDLRKDKRAFL